MGVALVVHLVVGLTILAMGDRAGRHAFTFGALAPATSLVWLLANLGPVLDGNTVTEHLDWVPRLGLGIDIRLDGFAALMVLVVAGIGVAVFVYASAYFGDHLEPGTARLAGLMVLFGGSMLGVVTADNVLVLYGAWELTSVFSFLLVGNQFRDAQARKAATQAILVTGAGGLCLLAGLVILGREAGTYRLSGILEAPPSGAAVNTALALAAVGAFTKSAQYPFHAWLPGAMVAPTPVSAYLHSATMVKAGVYLIARLAPAFAAAVPGWRAALVVVGCWTMIGGGIRALRQYDLKLILAYGTISQLGFMVALFGLGIDGTTFAAAGVVVAHAVFKATLFMVVGIVDHGFGTRDVREIPREAGPGWRATRVIAVIAAASMAGVPATLGFVAKEVALDASTATGLGAGALVAIVLVAGSALTAAYSLRVAAGIGGHLAVADVVHGDGHARGEDPIRHGSHAPSRWFVTVPVVLTVVTLGFGLVPGRLDRLVGSAATSLVGSVVPKHLAAWHGVNLALGLSAIAIAAGVALFLVVRTRPLGPTRWSRVPSGDDLYRSSVDTITSTATRVTANLQIGSMPFYIGVILATVMLVPVAVLLSSVTWTTTPTWVDHGLHVPIVGVMLGAALGAAVVRHRLSVALLLGAVGYGMALLFVVHGAPDLALTQAAVETLTTVMFVLALRRLPSVFDRRSTAATRRLRVAVSAAVAAAVFVLALAAGQESLPRDVSAEMEARALPDGKGRNVVNVILVDFRGLDTLGEISVVAVAAIGAVALARAGRRPVAQAVREFAAQRAVGSAAVHGSPRPPSPPRHGPVRHVFVDAVVRLLVFVALVVSVYLLVAGHNDPGGGFVGGLVAGAAVALRYVAGGIDDVRSMVRPKPWTILGGGLLLAGVTAAAPVVTGRPLLDNGYWTVDPPLLGPIGISSALVFDAGVYLVVVGLVFMAFEAFGEDQAVVTR